jgi:glycosyltransferase involved in cell wall biosynthesis
MNEVTVIIPNKDYNEYLDDAIASVKAQTVPCDLQVIDYGSRVQHPETTYCLFDADLSRARNSGVRRSLSRYILTLDADDILEPEFIERTLAIATEHTIVATGARYFGERHHLWSPSEGDFTEHNNILNCSLFPRSLWLLTGGWDETMTGYEDWDFWRRAYKAGYEFARIDEPLVNIRAHSDSRNHHAFTNHAKLHAHILR